MAVKKPSKTDFARWLDVQGGDYAPLKKRYAQYRQKCIIGAKQKANRFGFWLQSNHLEDFTKQYTSFFLKHPELMEIIYGDDTDSLA